MNPDLTLYVDGSRVHANVADLVRPKASARLRRLISEAWGRLPVQARRTLRDHWREVGGPTFTLAEPIPSLPFVEQYEGRMTGLHARNCGKITLSAERLRHKTDDQVMAVVAHELAHGYMEATAAVARRVSRPKPRYGYRPVNARPARKAVRKLVQESLAGWDEAAAEERRTDRLAESWSFAMRSLRTWDGWKMDGPDEKLYPAERAAWLMEGVELLKERRFNAEVQRILEACVPNKTGAGHHDDKTGHPCKTGTDAGIGAGDATGKGEPPAREAGKGGIGRGKADAKIAAEFLKGDGKPVAVESGAVKQVAWDAEKGTFSVLFRDQAEPYEYSDVSRAEVEQFLAAESKGQWVNRCLKGITFAEAEQTAPKPVMPLKKAAKPSRVKAPAIPKDVAADAPVAGKTGRANQVVAEGNQVLVAAVLGKDFESVPGNAPMDVHRREKDGTVVHGVECKTLLESKTGQVHIDDAAAARKQYWLEGYLLVPESRHKAAEHGPALGDETLYDEDARGYVRYRVVKDPTAPKGKARVVHMAVIDHRDEWAETLEGKFNPNERKWGRRQVYYARHFGSAGIGREGPPPLIACDNPDAYQHLMTLPDAEVQAIAEKHQFGALAYPSGNPVPQRGTKLKPRDWAAQTYGDVTRRRDKLMRHKVALGVAVAKGMEYESRLNRLKEQPAPQPTNGRERKQAQRREYIIGRLENAVRLTIPHRMEAARKKVAEYQSKLALSQGKWDNIRRGLPDGHVLKQAQ